jgi:hypothetical protein
MTLVIALAFNSLSILYAMDMTRLRVARYLHVARTCNMSDHAAVARMPATCVCARTHTPAHTGVRARARACLRACARGCASACGCGCGCACACVCTCP